MSQCQNRHYSNCSSYFVHVPNVKPENELTTTPHYLVISMLFKMGKENPFITEFLHSIPKHAHDKTELKTGKVHLNDLLSSPINDLDGSTFYHYKGSLTTPPYTETVQWFVYKQIIEASPKQIQTINKIEGNNARHIQALYGRQID